MALKSNGLQVDDFDIEKIKPYSIYVIVFVLALYTNMQALKACNVETVILFRACTPISVSIIEYLFMNRDVPSPRSTASLLVVAFGALFYCLFDSELALHGISSYYWALLYFFLISFEMTYGKQLTSTVKMGSVWGPVLYCNVLSIIPMALLGYSTNDIDINMVSLCFFIYM